MNSTDVVLSRREILLTLASIAGMAVPGRSFAESAWPTKPIRFVVPFAPGGGSEIVARSTAAELTKLLGQNVYVDNKPAAPATSRRPMSPRRPTSTR